MGWQKGTVLLLAIMALAACDGREESAIDNLANGANAAQVGNELKAEAQALMEPLAPPPPGTPGGLPVTAEPPVDENAIDPDSAQGAAQVVQGYYGLLEEKRYGDAQDLWNEKGSVGSEEDVLFAARFRGFSEIHANVGAPGEVEGAAGSLYVTVPVQVYGRLAATGKPWYMLRQVTLRRVNDVPGSSESDRRWHIESIGAYVPPEQPAEEAAANAISPTDGMVRPR
ncbi:hypothetical protein [Sphingobium cloacae]|uniref:Lipoprotein n=1 Tax=Sphingobium cloacae TaxID=120107 RepID=A0A1E1F3J6_9SPHN|nr:hypothetical protein [Sphingobium cloacae]BAV65089.1 hypothetical protein SCLO_1020490 [Sphingobium cloacae]